MPILKTVDLEAPWKTRNLRLIDYQILKTAGLAGLEGLLSLLLQQAEGLADFGEVIVSFENSQNEANLLVLLW